MDIIVSPTNIEFGEVMNIFQLIYKVRDEGKGVDITGGMSIKVAIVLARVEFAICLFNKEEGRGL